ncbi:MAG: hypothetical protein QE271_10475 [Bacteriovoracaceae bacterium]|nr:hypothetical protein [Bacteriovoracaceae bacterium]
MEATSILTQGVSPTSKAAKCAIYTQGLQKYHFFTNGEYSVNEIPASLVEKIKSHKKLITSLKNLLKKKYDGIEISNLFVSGSRFNLNESGSKKGETIQADFIDTVLAIALQQIPESNLGSILLRDGNNASNPLKISLSDFYELAHDYEIEKFDSNKIITLNKMNQAFNMPFIKAANPLVTSLDKINVKKSLGLNTQQKIIHIYMNDLEDGATQLKSIIYETIKSEIFKESKPVFILSFRGEEFDLNGLKDTQIFELSGWLINSSSVKKLNTNKNLIIFNDTVGKMPELYAASDLAVVVGAINFFESLNQGTPTIIYNPSGNSTQLFNRAGYKELIEIAQQTGNAKYAEQPDAFLNSLNLLLGPQNTTEPKYKSYEVRHPRDTTLTVFDFFLDHLSLVINAHLADPSLWISWLSGAEN